MFCVILSFNLFISSTTDFTVTDWFRNFNSVQRAIHNAWEIFWSLGCIYDALQHNINWKTWKYDFFVKIQKIWFKSKNLIF